MNALTARKVDSIKAPGRYADGGGLYLIVEPSGARRWAFIFRWKADAGASGEGRKREMGLGPANAVSLAEARELAAAARAQKAKGIDPIAARTAERSVPTFGALADELIALKSPSLGKTSIARWKRALEVHAEPLRGVSINALTDREVIRALEPIWAEIPEMARKTRAYIAAVFDNAKARGFYRGDNPASWSHLSHFLSERKADDRQHHAALDYRKMAGFMADLRKRDGVAAIALQVLILTVARTEPILHARWSQIDRKAKTWTYVVKKGSRSRNHRVALSDRALELLEEVAPLSVDDLVFVGPSGGPLSNGALERVLDRMKVNVTVHGFRSTFRDWAAEVEGVPFDVAELCLSHLVGSSTELAYRRGDMLDKRRAVMEAWAAYCDGA